MSYQICLADRSHYPVLIDIWEASVRATHHFLREENIAYFRQWILDQYFDAVKLFYLRTGDDEIAGLLGLSDGKIEMLFIHPRHFRQGYGSVLTDYAIAEHGITAVDVNEDNPEALAFYCKKGFRVVNRLAQDGEGNNFPILQMVLDN